MENNRIETVSLFQATDLWSSSLDLRLYIPGSSCGVEICAYYFGP